MVRTQTRGWNAAHVIAAALQRGEGFRTGGALSGRPTVSSPYLATGHLPRNEARRLHRHLRHGRVTYVVYSYGTPIAYHVTADPHPVNGKGDEADTWILPDVRYSITTSGHQGHVRYALQVAGVAVRA